MLLRFRNFEDRNQSGRCGVILELIGLGMETLNSSMSVFARKPRRCPSCGGRRVSTIFYGHPVMDEKMRADYDAGKISFEGSCGWEGSPKWKCVDCDFELFKAGE